MVGENLLVTAGERRKVVDIHVIKDAENSIKLKADMDEEIWDPGFRSETALLFDGIVLDHRNEHARGEGVIGVLETLRHVSYDINDCFIRSSSATIVFEGFEVSGVNVILPSCTNFCLASMIRRLKNQKRNIVVVTRICVDVVKLELLETRLDSWEGNSHDQEIGSGYRGLLLHWSFCHLEFSYLL